MLLLMMHGWMSWWMVLSGVFTALFLIALLAVAVWAVNRSTANRHNRRENPADTVRERYARGEIGREEYERMLQDLRR